MLSINYVKRKYQRYELNKNNEGVIRLYGNKINCKVLDINVEGAKIKAPELFNMDDDIVLEFRTVYLFCKILYINGEKIGVKFNKKLTPMLLSKLMR